MINMHVRQAEALLVGRLDLLVSGFDAAYHDDRIYSPFPIGPALLLVPLVAVFGPSFWLSPALGAGLTAVSIWALLRLMRAMNVDAALRPWLLVAFFMGTGYWFCLLNVVGVWYLSILTAVTFVSWRSLKRRRAGGH